MGSGGRRGPEKSRGRGWIMKKSGFVYAIEPVGLGVVKVGCTSNPSQRAESLAAFSPVKMVFRHLLDVGNWGRAKVWESEILAWSRGSISHGEWRSDLELIDQLFAFIAPAADVSDRHAIKRKPAGFRTPRTSDQRDFLLEVADFEDVFEGTTFEAAPVIGCHIHDVLQVAKSRRRREEVLVNVRDYLSKHRQDEEPP